jgi:hypothetical protein
MTMVMNGAIPPAKTDEIIAGTRRNSRWCRESREKSGHHEAAGAALSGVWIRKSVSDPYSESSDERP